MKSTALFTGSASTSKAAFSILEDDNLIPLPESENNFARGIQLPKGFFKRNLPQDDFIVPMHRDDEPSKKFFFAYDKFYLFPAENKSYSSEELMAYKWFKKQNIENQFTRCQDAVWNNCFGVPIRIPPHFTRKNSKQTEMKLESFDYNRNEETQKFAFPIHLIYASNGEYSNDELLQSKWINGELMSQKDVEMDLTYAFECRIEKRQEKVHRRSTILKGRRSILPPTEFSPHNSPITRKSVEPSKLLTTTESRISMAANEPQIQNSVSPNEPIPSTSIHNVAPIIKSTGVIRKSFLPKRKSISNVQFKLDTVTESPPVARRKIDEDNEDKLDPPKFNIFQDDTAHDAKNDDNIFKIPQTTTIAKAQPGSIFQDDDLEGCNTQMFNFYIKSQSISTPKGSKSLMATETAGELKDINSLQRGNIDFGYKNVNERSNQEATMRNEQNNPKLLQRRNLNFDENDIDPENIETNVEPNMPKQPFACRNMDTDAEQNVTELPEIYRRKLSAIMETTEEAGTISSNPSKTSSAEDFDYTKNTNQQSTTASASAYRYHTTVNNNTGKMSSSGVASFKETENKKCSSVGIEIFQDGIGEKLDSSKRVSNSINAVESLPKHTENEKTLPSSAQFFIYEDEQQDTVTSSKLTPNKDESTFRIPSDDYLRDIDQSKAAASSFLGIETDETISCNWKSNISMMKSELSQYLHTNKMDSMKQVNDTVNAAFNPNHTQTGKKPAFHMPIEDTGPAITMNFNVERTEPIPVQNDNGMGFTQTLTTDFASMCIPAMPVDGNTQNISQYFKQPNEQTANRSIFQIPRENTEKSMFMLPEDKTEPINRSNVNYLANRTVDQSAYSLFKSKVSSAEQSVARNQSIFQIPREITEKSMFMLPEDKTEQINRSNANNVANETVDRSAFSLFTNRKDNSLAIGSQAEKSIQKESKAFSIFQDDTDMDLGIKLNEMEEKKSDSNQQVAAEQMQHFHSGTENQPFDMTPLKSNFNETASKSLYPTVDDELYAMIQLPNNITSKADKSGIEKNSIQSKTSTSIDDEFFAMIKSPTPSQNTVKPKISIFSTKSAFEDTKSKFANEAARNQSKIVVLDTLVSSPVSPTISDTEKSMNDMKSFHSKSGMNTVDDELYAMINSPIVAASNNKSSFKMPETKVPRISEVEQRKSKLREPSMSLLQPMKEVSIREYGKRITMDAEKFMPEMNLSEENPHTALFSLNMPSIKNSTILTTSTVNIDDSPLESKRKTIVESPRMSMKTQFITPGK